MSTPCLELHFKRTRDELKLKRTKFVNKDDKVFNAYEGPHFPWTGGVIGLAVMVVWAKAERGELGEKRPGPASSLYDAVYKSQADGIKWPANIFGRRTMHRIILKWTEGEDFIVMVDPDELCPADIHVFVCEDGNEVEVTDADGLNALLAALRAEFAKCEQSECADEPRGHEPHDAGRSNQLCPVVNREKSRERRLELCLQAKYDPSCRIRFHVARPGGLAATGSRVVDQSICDCYAQRGKVWIGYTGGCYQAQMGREPLRVENTISPRHLTFGALNGLYTERHIDRGALFVTRRQVDRWGGVERHLPCSPRYRGEWDAYLDFIRRLDVVVLSGGAMELGFVGQVLQTEMDLRETLPTAVGDFGGHLVGGGGESVPCQKADEILDSFRRPLDLRTLRDLAASRCVIAVLSTSSFAQDERGRRGAGRASSALADACLRGGYANTYVIEPQLASALLALPPRVAA